MLTLKIFFISFSAAVLCALPSYAANKKIKIELVDTLASWPDKSGLGFAHEVVTSAFKEVHVDTEVAIVPFDRCIADMTNGDVVGCFSITDSDKLKGKAILANSSLYACHMDYYYNAKTELTAKKDWQIPAGKKIGVVTGTNYPASVFKLAQDGSSLSSSSDEDENLRKLALGQLDFAVIYFNSLKPSIITVNKAQVGDKVKFAFRGELLKYYIAFSKKHPDGEWSRRKFDRGFLQLKTSGALSDIEKRWIAKISMPSL